MLLVNATLLNLPFTAILQEPHTPELERVGAKLLSHLQTLERQISPALLDTELRILNANAFEEAVEVSGSLFALLQTLRERTMPFGPRFDPTQGKALRTALAPTAFVPPPEPGSERKGAFVSGWESVEFDTATSSIRFLHPDIEIHLGAVGRGYLVQSARDLLFSEGVSNALIQLGIHCYVGLGHGLTGEGWRVDIQVSGNADTSLGIAVLHDDSLSLVAASEPLPRRAEPFRPSIDAAFERIVAVFAPDAVTGCAWGMAARMASREWMETQCASRPELGFARFDFNRRTGGASDWEIVGKAASTLQFEV